MLIKLENWRSQLQSPELYIMFSPTGLFRVEGREFQVNLLPRLRAISSELNQLLSDEILHRSTNVLATVGPSLGFAIGAL